MSKRMVAGMNSMLVAPLVLIGLVRADDFKPEEGFARMDNGKDLSGWTGDPAGWSVQDGAIHLDAKSAKGSIYSETPHGRTGIIRLQFRATPRADSGVYIHGKQFQVRDYPTVGPKPYACHTRETGIMVARIDHLSR